MRQGGALRALQLCAVLLVARATTAGAQQFGFPSGSASDSAELARNIPTLASQIADVYRERDRRVYLTNLARLQIVAGRYRDANASLARLANAWGDSVSKETRAVNVLSSVYATAMQRGGTDGALRRELARTLRAQSDIEAAMLIRALLYSPSALESAVTSALRAQAGKDRIALGDALRLVKSYHARRVLGSLAKVAPAIVSEDDARRYMIETNLRVSGPAGATICAAVVRPKQAHGRLPTLLNFSIYADTFAKRTEARRVAASGYVAVHAFTRGKLCSPEAVEPFVHDGEDGAAVIDWIARQPWSDGRVGMYGGSYEGFTQWAIAKHMPRALKTIIPSVPVGPGIDSPMEGNIVMNFIYPWPFFAANNKTLDSATYNDFARWGRLNREWYVSGRPYRDLDKIDGAANRVFDEWLAHPTYDEYWQRMIPVREEFARVNIPVLATMGYFFGGWGAEAYYYREHHKYNPRAVHYLVAGPYDHPRGQRGVVTEIGDTLYDYLGYTLDRAALQDLWYLRFQWFDWIFKGAPKPRMLADRVNYEVMGASEWKHAPSIAAMADRRVRLYLSADHRLSRSASARDTFVAQSVDLADRSDIDRNIAGGGILNTAIDTVGMLQYVSEPFSERTEVSGLFSGSLDVETNTHDFDALLWLFELTPKGEYLLLSGWQQRMSQANDPTRRVTLAPGQRRRFEFTSMRITSRMMEAGSRVVVLLGPLKAPIAQINLGSGKEVSDESVADARGPLRLRWFGDSYIELPVRHVRPGLDR